MQLHQLRPQNKIRRSRRIGRGGKRGTYSGRGIKGQRARAGAKIRPAEREILKKIPKLRGYKFKSWRKRPVVVNLAAINEKFKSGDTVSPESLLKAGLVSRIKGRIPPVKILGKGELKKKIIFKDVNFSKTAKSKL
ncbi:MAG: uL15 family ribosomal protein [Candidatus Sungiibacteriota bacterium]|uniref:Large ribosomal subunit protein uL15 n=1 Tax=Candidatus Sungiibacteriota bacterium TaxID=2750080 RepID=A0A7T5UQF4_9BACT|nr:MAG: uL15 family ribosomal protein [Candidatus Sungbacteria bacterium]